MSQDWPLPRRPDACSACGRRFEVGDRMRACLLAADDTYERRDYCVGCDYSSASPVVGTWLTQRAAPHARRTTVFDREAVFELFRSLGAAQSEAHVQLRFVLALLLWRRKVLALQATLQDDAGEFWRFTLRTTAAAAATAGATGEPGAAPVNEEFDVRRPPLDEQRVEALSAQVDRLIAGEPLDVALPAEVTAAAELARDA